MGALVLVAWLGVGGGVEATPFEAAEQGGIVVAVRLNGRGPFRFLLDTGSTHSAVTARTARGVGGTVVARAPVASALGGGLLEVVRIDRLDVGPLSAAGLLPSVLPHEPADGIDGVLGQDVLAAQRYTIDYRRHRILWSAVPADPGAARATFALEPRDGRFLVGVPHHEDVLWLVPDSGAATLLLFDDPRRPRPAMTETVVRRELQSLTTRRDVRTTRVRELRLGEIPLRDLLTVLVARPAGAAGAHDGLLPLHLFRRVTVDGPNRMLVLER